MRKAIQDKGFPYLFRAILFGYLGWEGIIFFSKNIVMEDFGIKMVYLFLIAASAIAFAYGVISLIVDWKQGQLSAIRRRIKVFWRIVTRKK